MVSCAVHVRYAVPGRMPICFLLGQVTPKAAPSTERKQPAPTTQPPQQPHLPQAEPPVQQKTPSTPMQKAPQQGIGAQPRQLAASTLRAVQRLKRGAADATEGLLLRGRALLPRSLSSLPRFVQVPSQPRHPQRTTTCFHVLSSLLPSTLSGFQSLLLMHTPVQELLIRRYLSIECCAKQLSYAQHNSTTAHRCVNALNPRETVCAGTRARHNGGSRNHCPGGHLGCACGRRCRCTQC